MDCCIYLHLQLYAVDDECNRPRLPAAAAVVKQTKVTYIIFFWLFILLPAVLFLNEMLGPRTARLQVAFLLACMTLNCYVRAVGRLMHPSTAITIPGACGASPASQWPCGVSAHPPPPPPGPFGGVAPWMWLTSALPLSTSRARCSSQPAICLLLWSKILLCFHSPSSSEKKKSLSASLKKFPNSHSAASCFSSAP